MMSEQIHTDPEAGMINIWFCLLAVIVAIAICFLPGEVSVSFYSMSIITFGFIAMILYYFIHGKYQKKINWVGYTIGAKKVIH